MAAGYGFGFRFTGGVGTTIGFGLVAVFAATSFIWVGLFVATITKSQEALGPPLNAVFLILLFFSGGLVPLDAYPGWSQPLVRANPATAFVTALDRLARGEDMLRPLLIAGGWGAGLTVMFGWLAVARLRLL